MADEKSPLDLASDIFVYAPVGLALVASELLPQLVNRGRAYLGGQVPMARAVGQMAVRQGQTEASKVVDQALSQVGVVLEGLLRNWATGGQGPATSPASSGATGSPGAAAPGPGGSGPGASGTTGSGGTASGVTESGGTGSSGSNGSDAVSSPGD